MLKQSGGLEGLGFIQGHFSVTVGAVEVEICYTSHGGCVTEVYLMADPFHVLPKQLYSILLEEAQEHFEQTEAYQNALSLDDYVEYTHNMQEYYATRM